MLQAGQLVLRHSISVIICEHARQAEFVDRFSRLFASALGGFTQITQVGGWVMQSDANDALAGQLVTERNIEVSASFDKADNQFWLDFSTLVHEYWLGCDQDAVAVGEDGALNIYMDRNAYHQALLVWCARVDL